MRQIKSLLMIIAILFLSLTFLYSEEHLKNNVSDYSDTLKRNVFAFLVGNNHFSGESYKDLSYCINDILLIKGLLAGCVKVPEKNIHTYFDLTASDLSTAWIRFINQLTPDALVIIYFSSHGTEKGALVLSDSSLLTPGDLRTMVNSFSQDTVLMVDACYSGNGENAPGLEDFKQNSLRLYSSLGYSPSRELKYKDTPFFNELNTFFKQLPGVPPMEGNGYFTALIGNFFAHYPLQKGRNISFFTFFSYLSGKGKEYLEYLGRKKSFELSELEVSVLKESKLPKMEPIHQEVQFRNPDNLNIILKSESQSFRPEKNYLSLSLFPAITIVLNKEAQYNLGAATLTSMAYHFNFRRSGIFGVGFKTGYSYNSLTESGAETGLDYQEAIIPLTVSFSYATNWISPLQISAELYGGAILWHNIPYDPESEPLQNYPFIPRLGRTIFGGGFKLGANYSLSKNWNLGVHVTTSYFSGILALSPGIGITRILMEF